MLVPTLRDGESWQVATNDTVLFRVCTSTVQYSTVSNAVHQAIKCTCMGALSLAVPPRRHFFYILIRVRASETFVSLLES
jgi:hypothetical protein